jgi:micrococcal nuclease
MRIKHALKSTSRRSQKLRLLFFIGDSPSSIFSAIILIQKEIVVLSSSFIQFKMHEYHSRKTLFVFLSFVIFFCTAFTSRSETGRVVGVSDGDTITILHDDYSQEKIRLFGIDCPEKSQAFGQRAKQFTSSLVYGKVVRIRRMDEDRYGRTVAWIFHGNTNVNAELVRAGYAWHFRKYSDDLELQRLEDEARKSRRGLWVYPNPVPPWEYRRTN